MRKLRYKFWLWIHDRLELMWHWVYRNRVRPLSPLLSNNRPVIYTKVLENEHVTIYRTN